MAIERRALSETVSVRSDGESATVSGYAAMYNAETVIGGMFREQIAPGAFETALAGADDVRALFNHDPNILLGRTKSGTLRLSEDARGLRYDIDLPNTQDAQDVRELIRRGDVTGSSFGFRIIDEDITEATKRGGLPLVTVRRVELFDVSPVTFPAYPQTSVTARSLEQVAEALRVKRGKDLATLRLMQSRIAIARARAWVA